jgi:hypothetical protein
MASPEFAIINGQSVRLTSLKRTEEDGTLTLVVIVRGDAARDELTTLLDRTPLPVAFPNEDPESMKVTELDLRSTGEGARTIHRFAISLVPQSSTIQGITGAKTESSAESALMQRLDAIERKLDRLLQLADERS